MSLHPAMVTIFSRLTSLDIHDGAEYGKEHDLDSHGDVKCGRKL